MSRILKPPTRYLNLRLINPKFSLNPRSSISPIPTARPFTMSTHNQTPVSGPKLPPNSWDSHMHILDSRFPLSADALYKPAEHTLSDAMTFESSVGLSNIVLVQPSIYGNDNSCIFDALQKLGADRARGVVTFDPATIELDELRTWHELGVRGVRINLKSVGKVMEQAELRETLQMYADAVRPLDWVVQLYLPMQMVPLLERIVPDLGVRVCVDHMGHPPLGELEEYRATRDPDRIPGFDAFVRLLRAGKTYVKISAPYRMSGVGDGVSDVVPIARKLIQAAPDRVVFATDWPHTRFDGLDIRPWVKECVAICDGDEKMVEKLFRDNAEALWDVKRT
ncbi:amidohydrolase [Xylariaceae sp. FL1272]|nr:amidohydrolase [Xylariaceae sp. FL1272]